MRLFAGPLPRRGDSARRVFATPWTPDRSLASEDGSVAPEFVWAALDCPSGYAVAYDAETGGNDATPVLLGRLSVRIDGRPQVGEPCVVTSWEAGREGRRRIAETALHGEGGKLLAIGRAVWITVNRDVQLGTPSTGHGA